MLKVPTLNVQIPKEQDQKTQNMKVQKLKVLHGSSRSQAEMSSSPSKRCQLHVCRSGGSEAAITITS